MRLQTRNMFKEYSFKDENLVAVTDEQVKDIQQELWKMFQELAAVCKKYNLSCGFCGGSAIGTLRHHDFLPWDDDLDLMMPRADFDKLEEVFEKELGERYWLHTPANHKGYRILLCRIRKKGTVYRLRDDLQEDEAGLFLDVFVLENTFDSAILRNIHGVLSYAFGFLFSCRKFKEDEKELLKRLSENKELARAIWIKSRIGDLCSFASVDRWRIWADKIHRMCKNSNSRYVVSPAGRGLFFKEIYHRENMCVMREEAFADGVTWIPAGVEEHLTKIYGEDYMIPPADKEKEVHILFEYQLNTGDE